jgi:hypothetical protein
MRRRRAMGMGVAVVMGVIMRMVVRHGELLYYNIPGVHALERPRMPGYPAAALSASLRAQRSNPRLGGGTEAEPAA